MTITFASVLRVIATLFINENKYSLLLVLVPLALATIISFTDIEKSIPKIPLINYSLISSIIVYLGSLWLVDDQTFQNNFIWIAIVLFLLYSLYLWEVNNLGIKEIENKSDTTSKDEKALFMIYYLNFAKTYDFITLINNKFKVNTNNEKNKEIGKRSNFDLGLSNIQSGVNAGINSSSTITKSEKILENFEIKNTKSTHLQKMLIHAKEVQEHTNLIEGSLIKFSNVQLKLQDQKENIEMIKLLLSGAFNDFNIKGQEEGMDFEMNLSSLINSFLSESEYQLNFDYYDETYYITIPLTGNEDFENDYTVNDLLTGNVTIIGVYKGGYERHTPIVNTMFNLNNETDENEENKKNKNMRKNTLNPVGGLTQSEYRNNEKITDSQSNDEEATDSQSHDKDTDDSQPKGKITNTEKKELYVDVIAVIQEVYFDKEDQ